MPLGRDPGDPPVVFKARGRRQFHLCRRTAPNEWRWQRRAGGIDLPARDHTSSASFRCSSRDGAAPDRSAGVPRSAGQPSSTRLAAITCTTFDIIVESMLGGAASLDAERYSRALTENFPETITWHLIYDMFAVPEWMPFLKRRSAIALARLLALRYAPPDRGAAGKVVAAARPARFAAGSARTPKPAAP